MIRKWLSMVVVTGLALASACGDDDKESADGSSGDGAAADGSNGDGSTNDGATGDGATGDGATGDGSTGDGATGDGSTGDAGAENCTAQMYAKYGAAGFQAVTDNILANVVAVSAMEPSPIGDSFKGLSEADVARVEANLYDFLVLVYGGPNEYEGKTMEESHTGLNITADQYTAFITQVVVPALASAGVPEDDITNCFAPPVVDEAFVASIVGR